MNQGVHGCSQLFSEFQASLDYLGPDKGWGDNALGSYGLVASRKEGARGQEGNESPVSPGIRVSFSQV